MKNRKYDLAAFMMAVLVGAAVLFGCGEPSGAVSKEEPLTVYLWEKFFDQKIWYLIFMNSFRIKT